MKVAWSEPAIADLDAIHDYIARDSPHYATRFVQRLITTTESVVDFPQIGRVVPEGDGRHREVLLSPYRIIYRAGDEDEIVIVSVIHSARDLAALWEHEAPQT